MMGGVSTIVFLHAHPDDEASQTSGSMARAVDEGHRVVVVFATNGDHGEAAGDLAAGRDRRRTAAAPRPRLGRRHRHCTASRGSATPTPA